jgi:hypothetical protein
MCEDVYAEMEKVFGTSKSDSANANFETWRLMHSNPMLFRDQSITASRSIGTFTQGDPLDTEAKLSAFSSLCIEDANAYSLYRLKRIEQFRQEVAALKGGAV